MWMLLFLVVLEFELDSLVISYLIIKIDPFQMKKIIFLTSPHGPKKQTNIVRVDRRLGN